MMAPNKLNGKADVLALLELINAATKTAISEYEGAGADVPILTAREPHPLDSQQDTPVLRQAIRILVGACDQLCNTLAPPVLSIISKSMTFEAYAIRFAVDNKIADIIDATPDGVSAEELSLQLKVHPRKLVHILRLLVTVGIFIEDRPSVFTNNRLSLTLLSTNPVSDFVGLVTHDCTRVCDAFPDAMMQPDFAISKDTAWTYVTAKDASDPAAGAPYFDWLKHHPAEAKRFNSGMTGAGVFMGSLAIAKVVPWRKFPRGATFCDVGSGLGSVSKLLCEKFGFKVTLHDLDGPLEDARKFWASELPEAVKTHKVDFTPLNFMIGSPMENQDIYYLNRVLHNWSDTDAAIILGNIRKVMSHKSRLFIHEYVLQPLSRAETQSVVLQAPKPLLPNYGAGGVSSYRMTMIMLGLFNSSERTYDDFEQLSEKVGLKICKVWDLGELSLVELHLKDV